MEKSLFEQMGSTYTQVGDYLIPNLILPEQQEQPIGVWGQRHARHLKQHHKIIYMNLLTSGKLNDYLVDSENQAENMFLQIVKQLAKSEGITEELKAKDQTEWGKRSKKHTLPEAKKMCNNMHEKRWCKKWKKNKTGRFS